MYLRLGWVVGNVGLLGTLIIVTLSTAITLLTALSICAIAFNQFYFLRQSKQEKAIWQRRFWGAFNPR